MKRFPWITVGTPNARRSLAAAVVPLLGAGGAAHAQGGADAPPPEEITVTGTRIRTTDGMAEPVPVTTLTAQELSLYEPGSTVAEQLDALPQFFQTSTAQRGGPALFGNGGGSYLNMRGLGPERTLVLFDGFRMPPADKRGSVNVDTFPTALVRSVDVVTGGASAAYGADAIGGVTNFILDREFEGMKFSAGTGMNEFDNDGKNWNVSVAGGTQIGERLQDHRLVRSAARRSGEPRPRRARLELVPALGHIDRGHSASFRGASRCLNVASAGVHVNGRIALPAGSTGVSALTNMRFNDDGSAIVPLNRGTIADLGCTQPGPGLACSWFSGGPTRRPLICTQPGGPSGAEVVQQTGFFGVKYDISDTLNVFADVLIGHVESNSVQSVSAATMSGPWALSVFRENAYLPPSVRQTMVTENRPSFLIHKAGSFLGGLDIYNQSESRQRVRLRVVALRRRLDDERPLGHARVVAVRRNREADRRLRRPANRPLGARDRRRRDLFRSAGPDRRHARGRAGRTPRFVDGRTEGRGRSSATCSATTRRRRNSRRRRHPGRTKTTVNGTVPLASPIGLDNSISECVPFNMMGNGQITPQRRTTS